MFPFQPSGNVRSTRLKRAVVEAESCGRCGPIVILDEG